MRGSEGEREILDRKLSSLNNSIHLQEGRLQKEYEAQKKYYQDVINLKDIYNECHTKVDLGLLKINQLNDQNSECPTEFQEFYAVSESLLKEAKHAEETVTKTINITLKQAEQFKEKDLCNSIKAERAEIKILSSDLRTIGKTEKTEALRITQRRIELNDLETTVALLRRDQNQLKEQVNHEKGKLVSLTKESNDTVTRVNEMQKRCVID